MFDNFLLGHQSAETMTHDKKKFCTFCDHTGIVIQPHFEELGENPLIPCPRCVLKNCKCGGDPPYYYFDRKAGRVEDCSCRETRVKIERSMNIYARSGINKKYRWKFLSHYESVNKTASEAKSFAYDIVRNYPDVNKGVYLWGNPGTGKTLLASIILTEIIVRHAVESRFVSISRDLFKNLMSTFVAGSEKYGDSSRIEKELASVDVLAVDDFGVQKETPWKEETLYDLVDARYEAQRFTIFTSNSNPYQSLSALSQGRVLSRIKEMCRIIEISGEDYRNKL